MIRTAVLIAAVLPVIGLAASPALAFEHASVRAPASSESGGLGFANFGAIVRMMPASASEPLRFGDEAQKPAADTVVYDVSKGRTASHIDVNDPRDNPFMEQPERKPAAQPPAQ